MDVVIPHEELLNVHRVIGPKELIMHLRLSDQKKTEGLFYQAKHHGQAEFDYLGKQYQITKNSDGSYRIHAVDDQKYSTEEFA